MKESEACLNFEHERFDSNLNYCIAFQRFMSISWQDAAICRTVFGEPSPHKERKRATVILAVQIDSFISMLLKLTRKSYEDMFLDIST